MLSDVINFACGIAIVVGPVAIAIYKVRKEWEQELLGSTADTLTMTSAQAKFRKRMDEIDRPSAILMTTGTVSPAEARMYYNTTTNTMTMDVMPEPIDQLIQEILMNIELEPDKWVLYTKASGGVQANSVTSLLGSHVYGLRHNSNNTTIYRAYKGNICAINQDTIPLNIFEGIYTKICNIKEAQHKAKKDKELLERVEKFRKANEALAAEAEAMAAPICVEEAPKDDTLEDFPNDFPLRSSNERSWKGALLYGSPIQDVEFDYMNDRVVVATKKHTHCYTVTSWYELVHNMNIQMPESSVLTWIRGRTLRLIRKQPLIAETWELHDIRTKEYIYVTNEMLQDYYSQIRAALRDATEMPLRNHPRYKGY